MGASVVWSADHVFFTVLHAQNDPFVDRHMDYFELLSLTTTSLTFFFGILTTQQSDDSASDLALITQVCYLMVTLYFGKIVWNFEVREKERLQARAREKELEKEREQKEREKRVASIELSPRRVMKLLHSSGRLEFHLPIGSFKRIFHNDLCHISIIRLHGSAGAASVRFRTLDKGAVPHATFVMPVDQRVSFTDHQTQSILQVHLIMPYAPATDLCFTVELSEPENIALGENHLMDVLITPRDASNDAAGSKTATRESSRKSRSKLAAGAKKASSRKLKKAVKTISVFRNTTISKVDAETVDTPPVLTSLPPSLTSITSQSTGTTIKRKTSKKSQKTSIAATKQTDAAIVAVDHV